MRFAPSTDAATAANIPRLQESQSEMHAQSVHSPVPWSCSTVDLGSTATKLIQADMWGGWAGLLVLAGQLRLNQFDDKKTRQLCCKRVFARSARIHSIICSLEAEEIVPN